MSATSSSRTGHARARKVCSQPSAQVSDLRRTPRPRLNAPDGRLPLPFRSQTLTGRARCLIGEHLRTGWNKQNRKRRSGGDSVARFRGLRSVIHLRPRVYLTWAGRWRTFAGERPGTGVNETETETRHGLSDLVVFPAAGRWPGTAHPISWALNPEQGTQEYDWPAWACLRRSVTFARRWRSRLSASDGSWPLPFRSQNRTPGQSRWPRSPSATGGATIGQAPGASQRRGRAR